MRPFVLAFCSAVAIALAACSDGTPNGGTGSATGGAGGGSGSAGASSAGHGGAGTNGSMCALAPTGTFTFHVHNGTNGTINLYLGCARPPRFPSCSKHPAGALPAGPGTIGSCGFTCDKIYGESYLPAGCTDCGGGAIYTMTPGQTTDIGWDRRVYVALTIDAACAPFPGQTCALGKPVSRSAAQSGTLRVCTTFVTLGCGDPRDVPFTIDTTGDAATIEVAN